jgi:hypothetical protein
LRQAEGPASFGGWSSDQQQWLQATLAGIKSLADAMQGREDWLQVLREARTDPGQTAQRQAQATAKGAPGLRLPALGPGAREIEHCRQLQTALEQALQAFARYNQRLADIGNEAYAQWSASIIAGAAGADAQPPDPNQLLDSWLDCLTSVYERALLSDAYQNELSAFNLALQQVRAQALPLFEPWLKSLGLASRKDLAGTQERLHQWRRAQQQELLDLRTELDTLRARIDRLSRPGQDQS